MGILRLLGPGPVALDTSIFIYHLEKHPSFRPLLRELFRAIDAMAIEAVTSELTLLETLVVPIRHENFELAQDFTDILTSSPGLTLVPIDRTVLVKAASLRARHRLKTPDSLQVAAAVTARCTTFLTNDRRLPQIPGLRIMQLTDLFPQDVLMERPDVEYG